MDNLGALKLALTFAAEQAALVEGSAPILAKIQEAQEMAENLGRPVSRAAIGLASAAVAMLFGYAAWLMGDFPGMW